MVMNGEKTTVRKEKVAMSLKILYRLGNLLHRNQEGDCVTLCE
jgi:hypothetical protein